jgi:hypothetical protein
MHPQNQSQSSRRKIHWFINYERAANTRAESKKMQYFRWSWVYCCSQRPRQSRRSFLMLVWRNSVAKWQDAVVRAVKILQDAFWPTDTIIGGGNAKLLDSLPDGCSADTIRAPSLDRSRVLETRGHSCLRRHGGPVVSKPVLVRRAGGLAFQRRPSQAQSADGGESIAGVWSIATNRAFFPGLSAQA